MFNSLRNRLALMAVVISVAFMMGSALATTGQEARPKIPGQPTQTTQPVPEQTLAQQPALKATLVDAEKNAKEKTATVQAEVTGVQLIDPALTNKVPNKTQGHLHYRVDNGPIIATTATKLSFHELAPGKHTIQVMLAANDHSPMGPEQTLEVTVP